MVAEHPEGFTLLTRRVDSDTGWSQDLKVAWSVRRREAALHEEEL